MHNYVLMYTFGTEFLICTRLMVVSCTTKQNGMYSTTMYYILCDAKFYRGQNIDELDQPCIQITAGRK